MRIDEALREFLLRSPDVKSRVDLRIFPEYAAPEEGFPRIVYALQGVTPGGSLSGDTDQPTERWELACWGQGPTGYDDARALADAVIDATGGVTGGLPLKSFRGWMPVKWGVPPETIPTGAVWVQSCRIEDARGGEPEPAAGGEPKPAHKIALTLLISYLRGE